MQTGYGEEQISLLRGDQFREEQPFQLTASTMSSLAEERELELLRSKEVEEGEYPQELHKGEPGQKERRKKRRKQTFAKQASNKHDEHAPEGDYIQPSPKV